MWCGVITLFPDMFAALDYGIVGRAKQQQLLTLALLNPRDFAKEPHRRVDDRPYGGGPGMVMQYEPLRDAIVAAKKINNNAKVIYLSPQGRRLDQQGLRELQKEDALILLCGRYEGIDERVVEHLVDEEWSVGDYVLSGGEFAAMVMIDGLTRLLPGALGDETSIDNESFNDGLLDFPHYTRPEEIDGLKVPDILLSGDHEAIHRWRLEEAQKRTLQRRPDLYFLRSKNHEHQ